MTFGPNCLTEPTIRGVDAFLWVLRRLIIPCVSNALAGHILKRRRLSVQIDHAHRRQVRLSGRSNIGSLVWPAFLVVLSKVMVLKSRWSHSFSRRHVVPALAGQPRQVVYAITAALGCTPC